MLLELKIIADEMITIGGEWEKSGESLEERAYKLLQ